MQTIGTNGFYRTVAVLLGAVSALAGCGKRAHLGDEKQTTPVTAPGQQRNQQKLVCPPPTGTPGLMVSVGTAKSMARNFNRVLTDLASLSEAERDRIFVVRDIKGNEIIQRSSSDADKPTPPTIPVWAHKDMEQDKVPGTGTERAYKELSLGSGETVTVAVIDSGMDIEHPDLKANLWVNDKDKDKADPRYPGAVHGWNFLGGKSGSVSHTTLEVTRELKRLRALEKQRPLTEREKIYLEVVQKGYDEGRAEITATLEARIKMRTELATAIEALKSTCLIKEVTLEEIEKIESSLEHIKAARALALASLKRGRDLAWFDKAIETARKGVATAFDYYYNLAFDPTPVVGDNPEVMDEAYGNADVSPVSDDESHSTHVAGIIGAVRGNGIGMDGQAANVRLMALRAVPDGDERDKDVANAVKFAVDHGARVINMSFGKRYSPNSDYVWASFDYAAAHDVLIVHAAGNSALNNDDSSHFPDREVRDADRNLIRTIPNVLEVGASTRTADKALPAAFSDYGVRTVDLFAPGAQIYSTVPGADYAEYNGTSMASPQVAGVAALLRSQFPKLTALQVKQALMETVTPLKGLLVIKPGADPKDALIEFGALSQTGGVLNAYAALKAASKL
jgi:cell wall-associated protease